MYSICKLVNKIGKNIQRKQKSAHPTTVLSILDNMAGDLFTLFTLCLSGVKCILEAFRLYFKAGGGGEGGGL